MVFQGFALDPGLHCKLECNLGAAWLALLFMDYGIRKMRISAPGRGSSTFQKAGMWPCPEHLEGPWRRVSHGDLTLQGAIRSVSLGRSCGVDHAVAEQGPFPDRNCGCGQTDVLPRLLVDHANPLLGQQSRQ